MIRGLLIWLLPCAIFAQSSINITNVSHATAVVGTDYVLGVTNGAAGDTRLIPISLLQQGGSFIPQFGTVNLTNWAQFPTNTFYPSNNPAGFVPSNSLPWVSLPTNGIYATGGTNIQATTNNGLVGLNLTNTPSFDGRYLSNLSAFNSSQFDNNASGTNIKSGVLLTNLVSQGTARLSAAIITNASSATTVANLGVDGSGNVTTNTSVAGGRAETLTTLTNFNPTIDGNYQGAFSPSSTGSEPNKIGTGGNGSPYRNAGAAFSGIYSKQYGGSASALADDPVQGNGIWDNQRKPFFIVSTRQAVNYSFSDCTIATVTNGVAAFTTNGYVQVMTNLGVGVAFVLESGWVTNYRSPSGLLCWNSNRFPNYINGAYGVCATNLSRYLNTNGFEHWVMLYGSTIVPDTAHWSGGYSQVFENYAGSIPWDGSGANPFGAGVEYNTATTPESLHRDITSLYVNGVSGIILQQDINVSHGQAQQIAKTVGDASLAPYYLTPPDLTSAIATDYGWHHTYGSGTFSSIIGSTASHGMIIGSLMGSLGPWPSEFSQRYNLLITESNDGTWPTGSRAVGFFMGQVRRESLMLTNAYGYCHFTPATDASLGFNSYNYKDWQAHFLCSAFFNANIYLMGDNSAYFYTTNINFKANVTNANWIKVWQDITGKPPRCVSIAPSNSIWVRDMTDGSKLVLMENEDANNTTNLTVTWNQLGLASNTIVNPVEVFTNAYLGIVTNALTWTVPTVSAFLFKISPQILADNSTNNGQVYWDSVNNGVQIVGKNNQRAIFISGQGSGEFSFGTNDPAVGTDLGSAVSISANASSTAYSLCLLGPDGTKYRFVRDGVTGNFRIVGTQGNQFVGISIGSTGGDSEFARIGGQGLYMPTNPIAQIPTAPLTRGGYGLWNSNGTVYLLLSAPAGNAWISTNQFVLTTNGTINITGETNSSLTASRVILTDANKAQVSAVASGAVPIDADGLATTWAQIDTIAMAAGSNSLPYVVAQGYAATTNLIVAGTVNLTNGMAILVTNVSFTWGMPINPNAAGTTYQPPTVIVSNSAASAIVMTLPAGWTYGVGSTNGVLAGGVTAMTWARVPTIISNVTSIQWR